MIIAVAKHFATSGRVSRRCHVRAQLVGPQIRGHRLTGVSGVVEAILYIPYRQISS